MTLGIRMHGLSPEPHSLAEGQAIQDQLRKSKTIKVLLSLEGINQELEKDKQGELGRERLRPPPSFLSFAFILPLFNKQCVDLLCPVLFSLFFNLNLWF